MIPDMPWARQARCRHFTHVEFFPSERASDDVYKPARAVCRLCPVLRDCREYALAHEPDHGLWAGMTPAERRMENARRRRRRLAVAGLFAGAR